MTSSPVDPWFLDHLACPVDRTAFRTDQGGLICRDGHRYPVIDGVPILLRSDVPSTIVLADATLRRATGEGIDERAPQLYLETLGISDAEKRGVLELSRRGSAIDPVVAYLIAATNGMMYKHLIGSLATYPIPELSMPPGCGLFIDIGCSWGRWSIAAQRLGYDVLGVDPSLGAVMAARRVARQLQVPTRYVVADARWLPLPNAAADVAYSYSVLQHFSYDHAEQAIAEVGRVLRRGGHARVQMPTRYGVRCLYHQLRRGFRTPRNFEVRYWTLGALGAVFARHVGPARFDADGYFGIGLQRADRALMTPALRRVLGVSEILKRVSRSWPPLRAVADSLFIDAFRA